MPNSTYVLDTWTMSVQYQQVTNDGVMQSPSPTVTPCGAVLPTAPAMGALTFTINATGAPAPCTENVVFGASPPNQSPAPGASATPVWTSTLYVSVLPSPSPLSGAIRFSVTVGVAVSNVTAT